MGACTWGFFYYFAFIHHAVDDFSSIFAKGYLTQELYTAVLCPYATPYRKILRCTLYLPILVHNPKRLFTF